MAVRRGMHGRLTEPAIMVAARAARYGADMERAIIRRWWIGWGAAWLALTGLDAVAGNADAPMLSFCVTFIAVSAVLVDVQGRAGELPRRSLGLFVTLGAAVGAPIALSALEAPEAAAAFIRGGLALSAAAWLGAALGRGMQSAAHLWPLVLVALSADLWSVTAPSGVTSQLLSASSAETLSLVTLNAPAAGLGLVPVLGLGDVVFIGFLSGACAAVGLPHRRAGLGTAAGLAACLVALVTLQVPLPALVFIGPLCAGALGRAVVPRPADLALAAVVAALPWLAQCCRVLGPLR